MNRHSPFPKSPLKTRSDLRRALTRASALAAMALLLGTSQAARANTEDDVINGQTDLTLFTTYSGGSPGVTSDVTFYSLNYAPAAFTLGSDLSIGTLDDLSSTALTITRGTAGTSTLTLNGGTDSVSGAALADLLYVRTGGSLTIGGGTGTLNLALAGSGNFDVAGTATISAPITGTGNFTRTGFGSLTLSGGINNAGTFTNSGTAPAIYPTGGIFAPPAGSTYINGTVGANVTGIIQNGTSDLVLNNLGATYNAGITIQNGVVIFTKGPNSLGAGTNTIFLGNASTTANATMDFAADLATGGSGNTSFANPITVGPKTGEGVNVISASDYNLTLTGAISLTNGDLTLAPSNTTGSSITITNGITGTGNVFVSDSGVSTGSVVTLSGATINNAGTITFNNAPINGINTTNTGTNTVSANIGSNVTQVIENSTNPLNLSGTNAYTGPTTILRGTINETGGSLSSTILNVGAGTFNYSVTGGSQSFTTTNLTSSATISNTIASTTLNLGTINRSGTILGTVNFATTTGAITTTNSNDASGILGSWATIGTGTALNYAVSNGGSSAITPYGSGTALTAAGGGSATTNFTLGNAGVTLTANATGNTLQVQNTDVTAVVLALGANNLTLNGILNSGGAGGSLTVSGGGKLFIGANNELDILSNTQGTTISSIIADNGSTASSLVYRSVGGGTLTLGGANTYTGGTFINGGTLAVKADNNLGGAGTITINGGTLQDAANAAFTLASNHTVSIGSSGGSISSTGGFNQAIVLGTANQLTGSGTLTLNGTGNANASLNVSASQSGFTGNIVINTGRLELNTSGATSPLGSGTITVVSGATLGVSIVTNSNSGNTIPNTIYVAGAGDNGAIHSKAAAGTTNTFSGPVILTANASVYDDVNNTSITAFSGGISGPYTLTLSGSGSYLLSGVNTQSALTLNNNTGTTQLSGAGTLGAPNVTLNFSQNGAKLDLNGTNQTIGTINNNTATILNNATGTASVLTINGGATTATVFADHTTGTGTLGLTLGGGTLFLSGANTYTGTTTIIGGFLQAGVATVGGAIPTSGAFGVNSPVILYSSGLLDLKGFNETIGSLSDNKGSGGTVTSTVTGGTPVLTVGGLNTSTSFAGIIQNGTATSVGLTKIGSGTQTLTGANIYTGATTVNGGTLSLAKAGTAGSPTGGTLAASTTGIAVNTGGTLLVAASNAVGNTTPMNLGGGMLSVASTVLQGQGGSPNGATASQSTLAGVGALTLSAANSSLAFSGTSGTVVFSSFAPGGFTLNVTGTNFDTTGNGGTDGTNDRLIFTTDPGSAGLADITINNGPVTDVALASGGFEIEAVPEPSTWMAGLASVGVLGLTLLKDRRKARRNARVSA